MNVLFRVSGWTEDQAVTDAVGQDIDCLRRATGGRVLAPGPDFRKLPGFLRPLAARIHRLFRGREAREAEAAAACHHFFRARLDLPPGAHLLRAPLVLTCVAAGAGSRSEAELARLAGALPPRVAALSVSDPAARATLSRLLSIPVRPHRSAVPAPPPSPASDLPPGPVRLLNASCPWQLARLEEKGIVLLSETLRRTGARATLLWRGPEADGARAFLRDRGVAGLVEVREGPQDVRALLREHHAVVAVFPAPHRSHAIPLSVLEAWAVGRPAIVSTAMPVAPLLREHDGGFAVAPEPGALGEALAALAAAPRGRFRHLPAVVARGFTRDDAWTGEWLGLYARLGAGTDAAS